MKNDRTEWVCVDSKFDYTLVAFETIHTFSLFLVTKDSGKENKVTFLKLGLYLGSFWLVYFHFSVLLNKTYLIDITTIVN